MLAFELESEIVGQMPTFMVPPQQPQGIGVPDFQRPQVEHTLGQELASADIEAMVDGWVGLTSMLK